METYHFVNIFETKGLEYALLICFLVLFVLLVRYLTPPGPPVKPLPPDAKPGPRLDPRLRSGGRGDIGCARRLVRAAAAHHRMRRTAQQRMQIGPILPIQRAVWRRRFSWDLR